MSNSHCIIKTEEEHPERKKKADKAEYTAID